MVGFDGWNRNSCMMHVALEDSVSGKKAGAALIRPSFRYVFEACNLGVAVGTASSLNRKALELNRHLGFRVVFTGRDWIHPGEDLIWMELRREHCRWLDRKAA